MTTHPKVIAAILNWNGRAHLEKYLSSVVATDYAALEIVLIDNDSSDDSVAFVKEHHPDVRIVHTGGNYGYAGGYRRGLENLDAEYFLLINSDIKVGPKWLSPIIEMMERDSNIGACQPKILSLQQPNDFEYAGAAGGYIDYLAYPFCKGRIFNLVEKDKGQYNSSSKIFWASGACMVLRKEAYLKAGGLDEDFFAHMEEIDLCWRMQHLGYSIQYCAESSVLHLGGGSLTYGDPRKTFLNFRNSLIMNVKNMPLLELVWKLPMRLALDVVAAWKILLEGKSGDFKAIAKAHIQFFFKFGKWWSKRKDIGNRKSMRLIPGVYSKSIVLQSFLRGVNRFSELKGKFSPFSD